MILIYFYFEGPQRQTLVKHISRPVEVLKQTDFCEPRFLQNKEHLFGGCYDSNHSSDDTQRTFLKRKDIAELHSEGTTEGSSRSKEDKMVTQSTNSRIGEQDSSNRKVKRG